MIIQRPSDDEFSKVVKKYGLPKLTHKELHLNFEFKEDLECNGEAVLEIIDEQGSKVGIRHKGGTKFVLPQGRIEKSETIIQGVKREALEETGFEINIKDFKEVRDLDIEFSNEILNRWYLLFVCEICGGGPEPLDKEEIEDVAFFEEVPWKMDLY